MAKASLVIMAAGLGSRYGGGIKQMTPVGPGGEILMDYAIHDAIEAGFDKVVFIIRRDLDKDFRELIGDRISKVVETAYAYQEIEDLPAGFSLPEGRTKPWGTGHAILAAKDVIHEPFVVINADDYYGKSAYRELFSLLMEGPDFSAKVLPVAMCGFVLGNTLSDHGGVTRGLLEFDPENRLVGISETKNIRKTPEGCESGGVAIDTARLASMNMWALGPEFIEHLERAFPAFLADDEKDPLTKEFLLPTIIDDMIKNGEANVSVVRSEDRWFGMTYQEDRAIVASELAKMVETGFYRSPLFGE